MITTEIVAVISVFGVVLSALISATISFRSSAKSIYINSVTVERMKWIGELRSIITNFDKNLFIIAMKVYNDTEYDSSNRFITDIAEHQASVKTIIMHLQGRGIIETNIVKLASSCLQSLSDFWREDLDKIGKLHRFAKYCELLAEHSNFLFKQEWEKIKMEASGPLYRTYLAKKASDRRKNYLNFCLNDGYFEDCSEVSQFQFTRPQDT